MRLVPTGNGTLSADTIALQSAADLYYTLIVRAAKRAVAMYTTPIKDYTTRNGTVIRFNKGILENTVDFAADLKTFTERYPNAFAPIIKDLREALGSTAGITSANVRMYLKTPLTKDFTDELKRDHDLIVESINFGVPQIVDLFNETGKAIVAAAAIEAPNIVAAAIEASSTPAAESSSIPAILEASKIAAAAAESSSVSVPEGSWSTFSGWVSAEPIAAGFVAFAVVAITVVTVKFVYDWYTAPVTDLPLATKAAVDDISSSATDNLPIKAGFDPFEGSFSEGVFGPFGLPLLILFAGVFYGSIVSPNLCKLYALDAMTLTKVFRVACQFFKFSFKKN